MRCFLFPWERSFMLSLSDSIKNALKLQGSRILLEDSDVKLTGLEIEAKSRELEKYLNVSTLPGNLVGVSLPNQAAQGLAIIAIIQSGRIPLILSYTDLQTHLEKWLNNLSIDVLVTTEEMAKITNPRIHSIVLHSNGNFHFGKAPHSQSTPLRGSLMKAPEGTGLVLYTSGSTGEPKGICIPALGILETSKYLIQYFKLDEQTVSPIVLPVCHSMALNTQLIPTLLAGGKSHFVNSRLGMNKLFRHISNIEGTFISLIGEVLQILSDEMTLRKLPPNEKVIHVQLAGGLISAKHIQMARELFPKAIIHKGYGLTESIRVTMTHHLESNFETAVGSPLPFMKVEIRNSEGSRSLVGEVGEIFVKGPSVMLGILGRKGQTLDADGFLATGDLGSLNEQGQLTAQGRMDSVFKVNGLKVSGLEIEKIALESGDYIRSAKCILVNDHRRMRNKVILFLEIPKDRQENFYRNYFELFHQALWKNFKCLSHFPKDIIITPRFPRTSNGKLSIKGLEELWLKENQMNHSPEAGGSFLFYKTNDESIGSDYQKVL
jgi:acyl-CoA synthetase (AMP-forming)/AMP-acid ligase II